MEDSERLLVRALQFAQQRELELKIEKKLGFGNDGAVWSTNMNAAIKVFERPTNYNRELGCYKRLTDNNIRSIQGFSVPIMLDTDQKLLAILMTIVTPPYLLDFGKSYLDQPPDFSPEVLADWEAERRELFEPGQWSQVQSLRGRLQAMGIYYFDVKPANICFGEE